MQLAAIVLCLAALGGATMAVMRLRGRPRPPTWMALGHGTIALIGVLLLVRVAVASETPLPRYADFALVCFLTAALAGISMFMVFHRRGRPLPIPLMLGHGFLALTGLAFLLLSLKAP